MAGSGKNFTLEVLIRLENAILNLVIANNRAILLIFSAEFTKSMLDTHSLPESTVGSPWLDLEKDFRRQENAILRLVFSDTVFHKRTMLLIIYAKYAECLLDILSYPESTMGSPWLDPENFCQNESSQKAGKCYLRIGFCVLSTFVQAICSLQLLKNSLILTM